MPPRKTHKSDHILAAATDKARSAILEITAENTLGAHRDYVQESERIGTHRFENNLAGYRGWVWFATVTRVPRGKEATVSEVGLIPSDGALLAPDWVPWSQRVRPEDLEPAQADADVPASADTDSEGAQAEDGEGTAPSEADAAATSPDGADDDLDDDVEDVEDIEEFKAAKRNPRRRRRR